MYKSCKTEKSALRQVEIENKFLVLFAKKHFDEISISDLCRELNIPRKSFYRYFETKEGLLKATVDHVLMSYESYSKNKLDDKRRTVTNELKKYFEFWLLEPQRLLLTGLTRNKLYGYLFQCSIDYTIKLAGIRKFINREDEWISTQHFRFAITGLMSITLHWFNSSYDKSPLEMALAAKKILTTPLFQNLESFGIYNE